MKNKVSKNLKKGSIGGLAASVGAAVGIYLNNEFGIPGEVSAIVGGTVSGAILAAFDYVKRAVLKF